MSRLAVRCVALLGLACAGPGSATPPAATAPPAPVAAAPVAAPPAPPPVPQKDPAVTETIEETTVGWLGDTRVPMGNVMNGTYTLADGTEVRGPMCALALPGDTSEWVGKGSVVEVEGVRWRVVEVVAPPQGLGSVTLERVE